MSFPTGGGGGGGGSGNATSIGANVPIDTDNAPDADGQLYGLDTQTGKLSPLNTTIQEAFGGSGKDVPLYILNDLPVADEGGVTANGVTVSVGGGTAHVVMALADTNAGLAFNGSGKVAVQFGSTAGTACEGNDSRLSNNRTPLDGSVTAAKMATASVDLASSAIVHALGIANGGTGMTSAGSTANRIVATANGSTFTMNQLTGPMVNWSTTIGVGQAAGRATAGTITVTGVGATDVLLVAIPVGGTFPGSAAVFHVSGANEITQDSGVDVSGTTFAFLLGKQ